jgi:hypothetical protein
MSYQGTPFKGQSVYNHPNNSGHYPQQRNQYQQNQPTFKKSGAKYTEIRKGNFIGMTCVNAWKSSKNGLITVSVMPYNKSDELVESEKGNTYIKMIARVNYPSGIEKVLPCLMNEKTKVISLSDISMCISPNGSGQTRNGKNVTGYFGTFVKR